MASLVGLSDHLANKALQSTIIVGNLSKGLAAIVDTTQALAYHSLQRSPGSEELFFKSVDDLTEARRSIAQTKALSPADNKLISTIEINFDIAKKIFDDIKQPLVQGVQGTYLHDFLQGSRNNGAKLVTIIPPIKVASASLIRKHENLAATEAARAATLKAILFGAIILGAIANVLACFVAVRGFTANIVDRLAVLGDNMDKMASSSKLNPLVTGKDEIAELDKFFHRLDSTLRSASQRDRIMLSGMPTGTVTFTPELDITFTNSAFETLTGFSQDLIGQSISTIFCGRNCPPPDHWNSNFIEEHLVNKVTEIDLVHKKGSQLRTQISVARYSTAESLMYVCSILDMTERHQLDELKKEFVNIVSHDMRTPLTSVKLVIQMVQEEVFGSVTADGKNTLQQTVTECDQLIQLISDLLTMSKIEAGQLQLARSVCSLRSIMKNAVSTVESDAQEHNLRIIVEGSNVSVNADQGRLTQVFANILSNAVKFSPANGSIYLTWCVVSEHVQVSIQDEGPGISQEAHQQIFERFGQKTKPNERQGRGLGLAVSKLILQEHNGEIALQSRPGQGTCFTITLPVCSERLPEGTA